MSNFFEGVGNALLHPFKEVEWMAKSTRDVLKGDMDLKDVPGSHQRMMNDITVPIFGDNKLSKNSDAIAGAVIGGIMAAPALMSGSASAAGSGGAPVVEAVGQSPLEAVLAGGGNASEVGSVSTADAYSRFGNVLQQFGKQMTAGSQQNSQGTPAPAFRPKFQAPQNQQFGQGMMEQLGSSDYNIMM